MKSYPKYHPPRRLSRRKNRTNKQKIKDLMDIVPIKLIRSIKVKGPTARKAEASLNLTTMKNNNLRIGNMANNLPLKGGKKTKGEKLLGNSPKNR